MNLDQALETISHAVHTKTGQPLSEVQRVILEGVWQGKSYQEISATSGDKYSLNYLQNAAGRDLWKLLRQVLAWPDLNKRTFRTLMENAQPEGMTMLSTPQSNFSSGQLQLPQPSKEQVFITKNSPFDIADRQGRTQELTDLKTMIIEQACRCIILTGLPGIGKTFLATLLAADPVIQRTFEGRIVWRSLQGSPSLSDLLASLPDTLLPSSLLHNNSALSTLLNNLSKSKSLLILDGMESLFQSGQLAGRYRNGYDAYSNWLQQVCERTHQSCLLITSQDSPEEIIRLLPSNKWIQVYSLAGLSAQECLELITLEPSEHMGCDLAQLLHLCQQYQGNPGAIKHVAQTLRQLFNYNTEAFLGPNLPIYGALHQQLTTWFERLSEIEREVLYELATATDPVQFTTLKDHLQISHLSLIEVLESLQHRSVFMTPPVGPSSLALHPLIQQYLLSTPQAALEVELDLNPSPEQLSQWLQEPAAAGQASGWYPIDWLFRGRQGTGVAPRLRNLSPLSQGNSVKRLKPIQLGQITLILILAITAESLQKFKIRIQVQQWDAENEITTTLSPDLILELRNQGGQILHTVQPQSETDFIQFPTFRGHLDEEFSLRFTLADQQESSLTEQPQHEINFIV